jgi:hypothetical protein
MIGLWIVKSVLLVMIAAALGWVLGLAWNMGWVGRVYAVLVGILTLGVVLAAAGI